MIIQIQDQTPEKDIERSLWYIRNKAKIKKLIMLLIIIISIIFFSISIYQFIKIKKENINIQEGLKNSINFISWKQKNQIQSLIIGNKDIIKSGSEYYDVVISVKNPNPKIAVTNLKYRFIYNDKDYSETKEVFILPNETKKLIDFNIKTSIIRKVDIEIVSITWKKFLDYELEQLPQNIFEISNENLIINDAEKSRSIAEFSVTNKSTYSWLESKFYVFLYLGTKIVAVNQINTQNFYSGEEKKLQTSWFYKLPSYIKLKIESETNILDKNNYIKPR
ncbi:MAG: hypothetical protein PHZ07_03275 [Patescibacteria group bacterium]|nr:hypothetical protein [Patescibacteria group bacterium]MDD4304359.1 hypothetical protein [Patescibacteria group bacterium]MDD4695382.1 hypothetical protein [Patescibacteria group bacterium]